MQQTMLKLLKQLLTNLLPASIMVGLRNPHRLPLYPNASRKICEHILASVPKIVYGITLRFTLVLLSLAIDLLHASVPLYSSGTNSTVYLLAGMGSCPVCHDPLGSELVMLPCGHQLCCRCSMTIIDRAPHTSSPQVLSRLTQMV